MQMAAERVLESSGDQPTEADARVRTRDVFFPRPRFSSVFLTVVVGLGRGPPRVTTWFRGDGVLTSTTPPRAVVTVASTPLRHAGRRRRPRGREGHRRALPVPGRARRDPLDKSYLGVGLPPITKSQGQEARAGARGALLRASGKKALTKKLLDIGALVAARGILAKGDVSRCLRCGEAAADGPGGGAAGEGPGGRGGWACYRGWVVVGPLFFLFQPVVARVGAGAARCTPPSLRRGGGVAAARTQGWPACTRLDWFSYAVREFS